MSIRDTAFDTAHRARVVAGIRALADLVEARTDLPVPQSVTAQYSILDSLDDAGRRFVLEAAAALGEEPDDNDDTRVSVRHEVARSQADQPLFYVTFTVHGVVRDEQGRRVTAAPADKEAGRD